MTVTGTEQRVYGTLTGGCIIDLHRFALVSGSTTESPTTAVTVTYGDTTPYKQCGYKYAGYLTLFLSISGTSVYAAVEVRICKNDPKRIVIETYGEVAKTVTGGMSLWFNKGTDVSPDWVKLNSTTSGVIMPYATTSYTFTESKRNGATTIDCCKKCPSCGCKNCNIASRFKVISHGINLGKTTLYRCCDYIIVSQSESTLTPTSTLVYGLKNLGTNTLIFSPGIDNGIKIEYTLTCNTIQLWIYITDNVSNPYDLTNNIYYEVLFLDDSNTWINVVSGFKFDIGVL